jgi:hypothetical protein
VFRVWRSDTTWYFNPNKKSWRKTSKIEAMKFFDYFASTEVPTKNPNTQNATRLMDFYQ